MKDHSAGYAWEKLHLAVLSLAASSSPLKLRLEGACIPNLLSVRDEDLPTAKLKEKFADLYKDLFPGTGTLADHLLYLSDDEVSELARRIVSLYDHVCRFMEPVDDPQADSIKAALARMSEDDRLL